MSAIAAPRRGARRVEECMGTVFTLDVRTPGVDPQPAIDFLHEVDRRFSTYRHDSEINRIDGRELGIDACHPSIREVLEIGVAAERQGWGGFSLTAAGHLDPSAVVKGWAVERASRMLVAAGSRSHLINGGGDIQTHGTRPDGTDWRVAIAHPDLPGRVAAVIGGKGIAVATSGSAERGAHVIDPRAGRPAGDLVSVTVVGRIGLTAADIRATTAFALGRDGLNWLAQFPDSAGMAISRSGTVRHTVKWRQYAPGPAAT